MIDLKFMQKLIQALDESSLDSLEIERGGTRVRLSKTPPAAPVLAAAANPGGAPAPSAATGPNPQAAQEQEAAAAPAPSSNLVDITSPMVGTFYLAPAPDAPPYVKVGQRIATGDTLCIIEAMKLMNELEAEVDGTIAEIVAENAQPVEYGQVLFRVDPA